MYPISNERVQWLEARIFLLGRMIQEFNLRQTRYQQNASRVQVHPQVMQAMVAEQLQLNIEKNCIEAYLEEQAQAAEADSRRQAIEDVNSGKH